MSKSDFDGRILYRTQVRRVSDGWSHRLIQLTLLVIQDLLRPAKIDVTLFFV